MLKLVIFQSSFSSINALFWGTMYNRSGQKFRELNSNWMSLLHLEFSVRQIYRHSQSLQFSKFTSCVVEIDISQSQFIITLLQVTFGGKRKAMFMHFQ